jgi:hypothetical protein
MIVGGLGALCGCRFDGDAGCKYRNGNKAGLQQHCTAVDIFELDCVSWNKELRTN